MGFIYEDVPAEDKQRIDFSKIEAWNYRITPYSWVIDRDLDAFLIFGGPEREPPYGTWFAFVLKGKVFSVIGKWGNGNRTPDNKLIIPVEVNIYVPRDMPTPSPEVDAAVELIKEAFKVEIWESANISGWGHEIAEIIVQSK
ncbi:MAG: hypothetical protein ABW202_10350 [Duganella sp.]